MNVDDIRSEPLTLSQAGADMLCPNQAKSETIPAEMSKGLTRVFEV